MVSLAEQEKLLFPFSLLCNMPTGEKVKERTRKEKKYRKTVKSCSNNENHLETSLEEELFLNNIRHGTHTFSLTQKVNKVIAI